MLPVRKKMRLSGWDYSAEGAYFLTLCTQGRKPMLSHIVGRGILDAPDVCLTQYGELVHNAISFLDGKTVGLVVHNWVIMPNHVHILVSVIERASGLGGASGMPRPTEGTIPKFVSSLKRFTNRNAGFDMWQASYYDHIIRDDEDFITRWRYIDNNPSAWLEDDYYAD